MKAICLVFLGVSIHAVTHGQDVASVGDGAAIKRRAKAVVHANSPAIVRFAYGKEPKLRFGCGVIVDPSGHLAISGPVHAVLDDDLLDLRLVDGRHVRGKAFSHLVELVNQLKEREVGFCSLQESIDTTSGVGKLVFDIFASLSEFERDPIRERTMAGLESARARGRQSPDLADSHDAIRKDIQRLKQSEPYRVGHELLKYSSNGFELSLLPSKGVVGISCYTQKWKAPSFRGFKGRIQEGVRMLDSRERIEQLYGEPDEVHAGEGFCLLSYSKLGLTLELINDELVSLSARKAGD